MIHIFHVHTFRCKHAGDENDEQNIFTTLSLGAQKITFTDHSPIPDYFRNRMDVSQLPLIQTEVSVDVLNGLRKWKMLPCRLLKQP